MAAMGRDGDCSPNAPTPHESKNDASLSKWIFLDKFFYVRKKCRTVWPLRGGMGIAFQTCRLPMRARMMRPFRSRYVWINLSLWEKSVGLNNRDGEGWGLLSKRADSP